jgi:formate-dependent nitrite reductase membrane component NrfD
VYGAVLTAWWIAVFFRQFKWLNVIEWLGIVPALMTAVYTAFLFAQAKGRDFWQSPMLAIHMLLHSLIAGGAAVMISDVWFEWNTAWMARAKAFTAIFMVLNLIATAIELTTSHPTNDAATVAKMITRGEFSRPFWLGTVLAGNVLPLLLFFAGSDIGFVLAGVLILAGLYIGEHIWVKAPQTIPLA